MKVERIRQYESRKKIRKLCAVCLSKIIRICTEKLPLKLPDADCFAVRGVSQYQLRGFIAQMEVIGVRAMILAVPYWNENALDISFIDIPIDKLKEEYLY